MFQDEGGNNIQVVMSKIKGRILSMQIYARNKMFAQTENDFDVSSKMIGKLFDIIKHMLQIKQNQ